MQSSSRHGQPAAVRWIDHPAVLYERLLGVGTTLWLWVVVIAVMDVVFTYHGLQLGLVEVNPVVRVGLATFGSWSLVGGKALALGVGAIGWLALDRHRLLVPAVFLVCWGAAAVSNVMLLATHA